MSLLSIVLVTLWLSGYLFEVTDPLGRVHTLERRVARDDNLANEFVELGVVPDCNLYVSWVYPLAIAPLGAHPCQVHDFTGEVLDGRCHEHPASDSNSFRVSSLL